eukprot:jgi/Mesen1/4187/ME000219S03316
MRVHGGSDLNAFLSQSVERSLVHGESPLAWSADLAECLKLHKSSLPNLELAHLLVDYCTREDVYHEGCLQLVDQAIAAHLISSVHVLALLITQAVPQRHQRPRAYSAFLHFAHTHALCLAPLKGARGLSRLVEAVGGILQLKQFRRGEELGVLVVHLLLTLGSSVGHAAAEDLQRGPAPLDPPPAAVPSHTHGERHGFDEPPYSGQRHHGRQGAAAAARDSAAMAGLHMGGEADLYPGGVAGENSTFSGGGQQGLYSSGAAAVGEAEAEAEGGMLVLGPPEGSEAGEGSYPLHGLEVHPVGDGYGNDGHYPRGRFDDHLGRAMDGGRGSATPGSERGMLEKQPLRVGAGEGEGTDVYMHSSGDAGGQEQEQQHDQVWLESAAGIGLLVKLVQSQRTRSLLRLARRHLPAQWGPFAHALAELQRLAADPSVTFPRGAPEGLAALSAALAEGGEGALFSSSSALRGSPAMRAMQAARWHSLHSGDGWGLGGDGAWLPFDVLMEDAIEGRRLPSSPLPIYFAEIVSSVRAAEGATWHDTFVAMWLAALRLVARGRAEMPYPHNESRMSLCLSILPQAVAHILSRAGCSPPQEAGGGAAPSGAIDDSLGEDSTGGPRAGLAASLQILPVFEGLMTPPPASAMLANQAAALATSASDAARVQLDGVPHASSPRGAPCSPVECRHPVCCAELALVGKGGTATSQ